MDITETQVLTDVPGGDLITLLLDDSTGVPPMDEGRRVFVNRNLRLDKIDAVGFDMDYTLAIYKKFEIEKLAFDVTVDKLIRLGYPEEVREVRYERDRIIRGLVVDKENGNVLKMDRYGHVSRAFHGHTRLDRDERSRLYRHEKIDLGSKRFEWVDTLFSLPEVALYLALVDWFDNGKPAEPVFERTYAQIAADIRAAIDEAHADDSIKRVVKSDPAKYVEKSQELALMLHRLRSSGKQLFVLTNSYWPYSKVIMSYLLDGVLEGYPSWRNYFDLTIVGARKPSFFRDRSPFLQIDLETDAPMATPAHSLEKGGVYQGGNLTALERMGRMGGDRVLYVGDHIYGDILYSKKSSLWRTCMIVPELEDVVWHQEMYGPELTRLSVLEDEVQRADYGVNYYKLLLNRIEKLASKGGLADEAKAGLDEAGRRSRASIDRVRAYRQRALERLGETRAYVDLGYNRHWGRLLIEGAEVSLFAQQIENFACVYTSKVGNFGAYSPLQYFRSRPERLPYERRG
ncbi:MAG: HAD-IG family 5'-nucleotidase [Planctomycetota bacterium]|jgi:HAD superfamily 5'-nucleotidase-like hydrolase